MIPTMKEDPFGSVDLLPFVASMATRNPSTHSSLTSLTPSLLSTLLMDIKKNQDYTELVSQQLNATNEQLSHLIHICNTSKLIQPSMEEPTSILSATPAPSATTRSSRGASSTEIWPSQLSMLSNNYPNETEWPNEPRLSREVASINRIVPANSLVTETNISNSETSWNPINSGPIVDNTSGNTESCLPAIFDKTKLDFVMSVSELSGLQSNCRGSNGVRNSNGFATPLDASTMDFFEHPWSRSSTTELFPTAYNHSLSWHQIADVSGPFGGLNAVVAEEQPSTRICHKCDVSEQEELESRVAKRVCSVSTVSTAASILDDTAILRNFGSIRSSGSSMSREGNFLPTRTDSVKPDGRHIINTVVPEQRETAQLPSECNQRTCIQSPHHKAVVDFTQAKGQSVKALRRRLGRLGQNRGTLELDSLIGVFCRQYIALMTHQQLRDFEKLLNVDNATIFGIVAGQYGIPNELQLNVTLPLLLRFVNSKHPNLSKNTAAPPLSVEPVVFNTTATMCQRK